jgi:hypothetical protein
MIHLWQVLDILGVVFVAATMGLALRRVWRQR